MSTFTVTIEMASPLVVTAWKPVPISLDGLLFGCIARILGGSPGVLPLPPEETRNMIPLDRETKNGLSIFKASLPFVEGTNRYDYIAAVSKGADWITSPWLRRKYPQKSIKEDSGYYQRTLEQYNCIGLRKISFFCSGDMDRISDIFVQARINRMGLGRLRRLGYGRVRKIDIHEVYFDHSMFDGDGRPTRPIPASWVDDQNLPKLAVSVLPPYWKSEYKRICVMPDPEKWLWN